MSQTSTEARTEALHAVQAAAAALRGIALDLDMYAQHDLVSLGEHGEKYAQDASTKVTLRQRVQDATNDMARAQNTLTSAVFTASAA